MFSDESDESEEVFCDESDESEQVFCDDSEGVFCDESEVFCDGKGRYLDRNLSYKKKV